jgi:hypothetical protein
MMQYSICVHRFFFGRTLKNACRPTILQCKRDRDSGQKKHKLWLIRLIYFINILVLFGWLSILIVRQDSGSFRCRHFSVQFGDDTWDEAWVKLGNGALEKRLLVYSHFNGVYMYK